MGRRGPAPAPTKIKLLRGETHRDRLNFREPRTGPKPPRAPSGMDKVARAVWGTVIREMPRGVITAVDAQVLRCYCEAVSGYVTARAGITASGLIVRRDGNVVRNPLLMVLKDHREAIRLLARELGLSPAARAGLRMELGTYDPDIEAEIGPSPRRGVEAYRAWQEEHGA